MIDMIKYLLRKIRNVTYRIYNQIKYKCQIEYSCNTFKTVFEGQNRISHGTYIPKSYLGIYSYVGANCILPNARIGRYSSIGNNVKVIAAMHPISWVSTSPVFYSNKRKFTLSEEELFNDILSVDGKSVLIGNDVWIGDNVLLRGGIKIGDGAIVAMGAVVTNDVPSYSIVGGVPAKIIKYRFSEADIQWLKKVRWWEMDPVILKTFQKELIDINSFKNKYDNENM